MFSELVGAIAAVFFFAVAKNYWRKDLRGLAISFGVAGALIGAANLYRIGVFAGSAPNHGIIFQLLPIVWNLGVFVLSLTIYLAVLAFIGCPKIEIKDLSHTADRKE